MMARLVFLLTILSIVASQRFHGILPPYTLPLGEVEPIEGPCPCIISCCQHPLQLRRAPGLPVNLITFSYECCGCVDCPPQVPRNPESEFPVVTMMNGQLVELDIEA